MNILSSHNKSFVAIKYCMMALLLTFATPPAEAQTAGEIHIGGKVYGGGKQGAINSGNTTATSATEAEDVVLTKTAFDNSADADYAASQASQVTIKSGNIKTVFGGGEQGRSYGKTSVTVNGGTIGVDGDTDTANGNVFGAGDGNSAHVYGGSALLVTGGTIKGSVYGGGNEADLVGSTALTLQGGTYVGAVYGGAKMANIFGRTYVNVDGANAKNDLHIIDVYGGNDIAGQIHPSTNSNWAWTLQENLSLPFTLATTDNITTKPNTVVNSTWNAFILATKGTTYKTVIDNLYGGGNGDYDYTSAKLSDGVTNNPYYGKAKPVIDRTYMQLEAGMYGNVYGGGNAATVAVSTDICLLNDTEVTDAYKTYLASLDETSKSRYSDTYQFNRVFGGNNKEPMAIRPNWYLEKATINNLYSGGNAGPMTYFKSNPDDKNDKSTGGILISVESQYMTVNNVYGGCRMADVVPGGTYDAKNAINDEEINGHTFKTGYAARVLIKGGNINNVYGGNDVSGVVYYGSQVEILSSINGDVYGAGNGSYAYTDNINLKNDKTWGDFYYNGGTGGLASAQALSNHRPNAEKTYVYVAGTESTPTYIGGGLYCGGNSATLRTQGGLLSDAKAELHIGSYVIADKVFLGSNGENMVASATVNDVLQIYKNGPVGYDKATKGAYSSMDLTDHDQFEEYMRGVEVAIKPNVSFDNYVDYTTKFGSLYCGGNVGSMSADGLFTIDFLKKVIIYDKLVGGSNNANVAKTDYNAFHMGGLIGAPDATSGNKVQLNISGLLLEPRVLARDTNNKLNIDAWNKDASGMLQHGNIYGGCYSSGYINGGVAINVTANAISSNVFTSSGVTYDAIRDDVLASTLSVYGGGYGKETEIWGNTTINITDNGQIMKAYGGGEMGVVGKLQRDAETGVYATTTVDEWYPTTKSMTVSDQTFDISDYDKRDHIVAQFATQYNATVNLNATLLKDADEKPLNNVAKLYAGGFQGTVSGNTTANLNRGRAYDAFGGASNADILGHTETYIGKSSAPTITHNVYGANDFGGLIVGEGVFYVDNNKDGDHEDTMEKILSQTYVEYASGKIGDGSRDSYGDPVNGNVFGGPCGAYDYADTRYATALAQPGFCKPMLLRDLMTSEMLIPDPEGIREHVGYASNSFVNVTSQSTLVTDEVTGSIFGAGQGMKGHINSADERGSYVRLMAATTNLRTVGPLSSRVYGAGYCSNTNRSLVDAHTGHFGTIFGAAHGISYEELTDMQLHSSAGIYETNYMGWRSAVRLYEMANRNMDIYGGGANAGAQEAGVVLYGGQARDVYGGQYDQGITYAASVDVPSGSTSKVNAIFGGARGKNDEYPCDVYNTYVTWKSAAARVSDAIYGGNNNARMTRNAYVSINQPVKNYEERLTNVFGGGFGENTVTLYTEVGLHDGAEVANAYGGGNNGKVLDTPSFRYYLDDGELACPDGYTKVATADDGLKIYPSELSKSSMVAVNETPIYGYQKYILDTEVIGFHEWIKRYNWKDGRKDGRGQPLGSYLANDHGHAHDLYYLSTQMDNVKNTHVLIEKGAVVAENVYGGGLGVNATVSGETNVQLLGGVVRGDIYGGGYGGHVKEYPHLIYNVGNEPELVLSGTYVDLGGGSAQNVYGGGLNGNVTGKTHVTLGSKDQGENNYYGTWDTGTTITPTNNDVITTITRSGHPYYGDPIVERSLYGGGQNGHVDGTTYLTINQGHVGYKYDASAEVDGKSNANCYVENLALNDGDTFLDQNGNAFGAGYGEGAYVDVTYVNMYGGTIRNSLYGGGEIAAVGRGSMKTDTDNKKELDDIDVAGRTHIYMYNGLVQSDVFGGGRGYSYDLTGNEVVGKTLFTDGYVFGTTEVEVRGGTIGTEKTVEDGHGNVFGGGNIGYCFSDGVKRGEKGDGQHPGDGRYYTNEWECTHCNHKEHSLNAPTVCGKCGYYPNATDSRFRTTFTQVNQGGTAAAPTILSEDCRVVITPYAQVTYNAGIDIDGTHYDKGDYVPSDKLDKLLNKNAAGDQWNKLSLAGVTVRNAVFAGGNVSSGSDKVYANAITVFGNATATVKDVFNRDLITLGTDHIGGLYGDGNLTFVDGYRELNITNFGTDYYGQSSEITYAEYEKLTDRERAYFKIQYECKVQHHDANTDKTYTVGTKIDEEEYQKLTADSKADTNWRVYGFCNIYAGRILNTIQRADFCGVFGSRLVLQGAQDRVPEVVDYTQYTINRVGEVSLNAKTIGDDTHGNYFGLYNVVNYLGALTSDVSFEATRTTGSDSYPADGSTSFYQWKENYVGKKQRNNGSCHNKVALASGVYLEIVQELGSTKDEKNYGYITGVVELDLINVMPGLGGGYVYARNEHGERSGNPGEHQNLSIYNQSAVNNSAYTYNESSKKPLETSGNFIHSAKQIIDDCFPGGGQYMDDGYKISPAHYWYIKGEIYVYDQYISAYTGSSNAYLENIDLPLTITAGSHGKLDLLNIQKNRYAYKNPDGNVLGLDEHMVVDNVTYGLNDVISYWDWLQLTDAQKALFVEETYTAVKEYSLGGADGTLVPIGTTMLPADYDTYIESNPQVYDTELETMVPISSVLRPTNNVKHENGYALTVNLTNPMDWDEWHSVVSGNDPKINNDTYKKSDNKGNYITGPTYRPTQAGVYGQRLYNKDDVVTKTVYDTYELMKNKAVLTNQADAVPTYISTAAVSYELNGETKNLQVGVGISKTEYDALPGTAKTAFEPAYTCTSTYEVDKATNEFVYYAELISQTRYNELKAALIAAGLTSEQATSTMVEHFDQAYSITQDGLYGGNYFDTDHNYRALESWSSLAPGDRDKFQFNYDALDVLLRSDYPGNGEINNMKEYDKSGEKLYQLTKPVDYKATWLSTTGGQNSFTYTKADGTTTVTINKGVEISREEYEAIPNEQYHYVRFEVKSEDVGQSPKTFYIVKDQFARGDQPYLSGQVIDKTSYDNLDDTQKSKVGQYTFSTAGTYFFCRDAYKVNANGEGVAVTDCGNTTTTYISGEEVPTGTIINQTTYNSLPNKQKNFEIHGFSPIETTTLFVSRESDIYDLSKDRIVTVIYQYQYEESDESGHIEQINERHVINIHIQFKSGVPTIGQLQKPAIVLPGQTVGLKLPNVSRGAYEILGGGWELFTNQSDAEKHQNGINYINNATKMYWYQNNYYVAYFAKTYLGKTYSNAVQFKVANYHDIADVMADTENYMFIDHPDVERDSKIYINSSTTDEDPDAVKSEIDMLYDLFQVSLESNKKPMTVQKVKNDKPQYYKIDGEGNKIDDGTENSWTDDVTPYPVMEEQMLPVFDDHARNCENLEFHITSDVATKKATWQPIGDINKDDLCFRGHVHGHGMTISGINNSLFENLCGDVYNLGVTGSFTKSGIADKASSYTDANSVTHPGMAQNCWIHTSGTPETNVLPVIGTKNVLKGVNDASGIHTFNCFYPRSDGYDFSSLGLQPYETATERPMRDFNNGSVAFDLNGFYLHKRYADQIVTESEATNKLGQGGSVYKYWIENADGTLKAEPSTGYYNQGAIHKYGTDYWCGYVENIYADGDFVYAMGEIPTETNERYYKTDGRYLPIWPDDYLFFGQQLTYGYDETNRPYQPLPSATTKTNDIDHRLNTTSTTNVVFRAPAYYRNGIKSVVHFNPGAVFADHIANGAEAGTSSYSPSDPLYAEMNLAGLPVHKGLTAIDFTGYNDIIKLGDGFEDIPADQAYTNGPASSEHDYSPNINFAPALNFTTLLSFATHGITQNLLTYAPSATDGHAGHKNTNDILTAYFNEPEYANYYNKVKNEYRTVNALSESDISSVRGHIVQKNGGYVAHTDHFLVDKQDFNAPIAYSFDSDHRMWYQRTPDKYADMDKGWEGISIPFAAELVSTQQKGEITHFYSSSKNGHEYWLRQFTGIINTTEADGEKTIANMTYPDAVGSTTSKDVTNTFLWDYYYNADGKDANGDDYRYDGNNEDANSDPSRNYYRDARNYADYPLNEVGKPYIVGFPSNRYYEFDLSGTFVPENSGSTPQILNAQTISFVSETGITINVSDTELDAAWDANKYQNNSVDYYFAPNYLNITDGVASNTYYVLNSDGSEFEKKVDGEGNKTHIGLNVGAFRPFFATPDKASKGAKTRSIGFGMASDTKFEGDVNEKGSGNGTDGLEIYAKRSKVVVESHRDSDCNIRITTTSGIVIANYMLSAGDVIETSVTTTGVYIVNGKKIVVK